jgi:hypothetical protein
VDGIIPDCKTDVGCTITRALPSVRRALELRGMLVRLHPLVDAGTVCREFGATRHDLELIAHVEDALREEKAEQTEEGREEEAGP